MMGIGRRGAVVLLTATLLVVAGSGALSSAGASAGRSCTPSIFPRPSSPGFASTTWPTEHADVWRTHAVAAGLPAGLGRLRLRVTSAKLPPVPVWGYVGKGRFVYAMGGAPYLLDVFTKLIEGAPRRSIPALVAKSKAYSETMTPYLARIDTQTMTVKVLYLRRGTSVNYTGGLLVHANGYLYAVARSVLYKIDPKTFSIAKSRRLPLAPSSSGPNENTAYNGIMATRNGDLILKGWASTGGGPKPPGLLLRVDPDDLSIKARLVTTHIASARMAIVTSGRHQYLYFPNSTQSVRFRVEPKAFAYDRRFSQTYLTEPGETTASSDVFMGNGVVFADNTDPTATTPMRVFAQDTAGSPLQSTQAFRRASPAWNFFMMVGDPYKSGIVAVEDQLHGRIAGFMACSGGRGVRKLWENDSLKPSAGAAIDYKTGQLYVDDRRCASPDRCRLFLVVLDLRTGRELARVAVKGTKPSIGQIFIGPHAVYYTATDTDEPNGYVTKVTAATKR